MQTYTAEQYKTKYGASGAWSGQANSTRPSITDSIVTSFKAGIGQAKAGVQQVGKTNGNPLDLIEGAGKAGAGVIAAGTAPLAPVLNPTVGAAMNFVADKISNSPAVQKFAQSPAGQATSRAAEDVANYAMIAGTVGGTMEVPKAATAAANKVEQAAGAIHETASNVANAVKERINPTIDPAVQLLKDATPDYSKKLISEPDIKNADGTITPRVQEGGFIKGRTVTPKPLELQAAAELSKVKDYPINGTSLEKYQAVQPEIASRGEGLMTSLKNENILRPPQQIAKVVSDAINKVPGDSLLLQKSDPVIGNYMRVAKTAIEKADGTLAGELKVRQMLDAAYKNARGKMAFGSDKLSALDDIHTAARDALNQDIIAKAKSTDVKASLKAQWDLMRASDVLRNKAEAEAGSSIGRFAQKNPIATKIIKGAGRAAGVGMGVHVIP